MSQTCYLCQKALPQGQSFYQNHGLLVCLDCFKVTKKCKKCGFPSTRLVAMGPYSAVCEYCQKDLKPAPLEECHLCGRAMEKQDRHFAGHGVKVCQQCFAESPRRCFTCRFPLGKGAKGLVCEFCKETTIGPETDLAPILQGLTQYLRQLGYRPSTKIQIQFADWRLVLGMQTPTPPKFPVHFFDEFIHYGSPVIYLGGKFWAVQRVPKDWFFVAMAGQLVHQELAMAYQRGHLIGETPFHLFAQGWIRYLQYFTAQRLQYAQIARKLETYPEGPVAAEFTRILGHAKNLPPKSLVKATHHKLQEFAARYLK